LYITIIVIISAFLALYEWCIVIKCLNEICPFKESFLGSHEKKFV
jgi:hypothetical protein